MWAVQGSIGAAWCVGLLAEGFPLGEPTSWEKVVERLETRLQSSGPRYPHPPSVVLQLLLEAGGILFGASLESFFHHQNVVK